MEPKKHYFAHIPTIAIFIAFALSGPLGLLLFLLKHIDKDAEKKELANAAYRADLGPSDTRPGTAQKPDNEETVYGHDTPTEEQKKAKKHQKDLAGLCGLLGFLFLLVGIGNFADIVDLWPYWFDWTELATALAQMIGGGVALWMSTRMKKARKLERQLDKIVGDRDNISLDELFAAAGIDAAKGRTTLEAAIDHGYFGADAYIDNRTGTLVVRGPAPQPPAPEPVSAPAEPEDQYAALLRRLRQTNDSIPDPVMTAKISRLEALSSRIFALAKQDPSKQAQLQKFMDYYLPTALKLLSTYAQLAQQDIQGQNITEAKQSIERSMDLLITAFENQLDKLFASDALDVSTDIAALEGMLNLDGLTAPDFPQ